MSTKRLAADSFCTHSGSSPGFWNQYDRMQFGVSAMKSYSRSSAQEPIPKGPPIFLPV